MRDNHGRQMKRIPEDDLQHILYHTRTLWNPLYDRNIFITAVIGFSGKALVKSFLFCNRELRLNDYVSIFLLSLERFLEDFTILCLKLLWSPYCHAEPLSTI